MSNSDIAMRMAEIEFPGVSNVPKVLAFLLDARQVGHKPTPTEIADATHLTPGTVESCIIALRMFGNVPNKSGRGGEIDTAKVGVTFNAIARAVLPRFPFGDGIVGVKCTKSDGTTAYDTVYPHRGEVIADEIVLSNTGVAPAKKGDGVCYSKSMWTALSYHSGERIIMCESRNCDVLSRPTGGEVAHGPVGSDRLRTRRLEVLGSIRSGSTLEYSLQYGLAVETFVSDVKFSVEVITGYLPSMIVRCAFDGTTFEHASGLDALKWSTLSLVDFKSTEFIDTTLNEVMARGTSFVECAFTGSRFRNSVFNGGTFRSCDFSWASCVGSVFYGARFESCCFTEARMAADMFAKCEFTNCDMSDDQAQALRANGCTVS